MCPQVETSPANGTSNGSTNGDNANGSHEGFTGIRSTHNPHPSHKSPYQPVGDFLSNVSRFKIIGTSDSILQRYRRRIAAPMLLGKH